MLTLDEATNIKSLSGDYKMYRQKKSARAIGARQDLYDAVLSALVRETVERAMRQLDFVDKANEP